MAAPSLQDGIDQAGSAVALLWKPNGAPFLPEVVEREYTGWRAEQRAWHEGVALLNLSHHMFDTFIEGPDATRLLAAISANNYEKFELGQAKQFVPVTERGNIITDGILLKESAEKYTLSGVPASQNWVKYHADKGGYDVAYSTDPSSKFRNGGAPVLFRYQIQGPLARDLVERAFGGPLPETKFFHSSPVRLAGRDLRAFRHGMAGQAGYEFVGDWNDAEAVRDALVEAGEPLGLVFVGARAYATANVEGGWIPSPIPAIYTDPELADYRRFVPLYGIEGQRPLHGSYFSENIEDYYVTPYELDYGRLLNFGHDFIGRDALLKARENVTRSKVTLVFDTDDVRRVFGEDPGFVLDYSRYRVETAAGVVGMTYQTALLDPAGSILSLAILENEAIATGTEVDVVWGQHPGPGAAADADYGYQRLRATVAPAPYNEYARDVYRRNSTASSE